MYYVGYVSIKENDFKTKWVYDTLEEALNVLSCEYIKNGFCVVYNNRIIAYKNNNEVKRCLKSI